MVVPRAIWHSYLTYTVTVIAWFVLSNFIIYETWNNLHQRISNFIECNKFVYKSCMSTELNSNLMTANIMQNFLTPLLFHLPIWCPSHYFAVKSILQKTYRTSSCTTTIYGIFPHRWKYWFRGLISFLRTTNLKSRIQSIRAKDSLTPNFNLPTWIKKKLVTKITFLRT